MNPVKKIYCRLIQKTFRLALPLLPYTDPKIYHAMHDVVKILEKENHHHPLIVTDVGLKKIKLSDDLENILIQHGITNSLYDQTKPNPTTQMVQEALKIYQDHQCDCIIALGGGSPMDLAKTVGACVARPHLKIQKMAGLLKIIKKIPTLIAIPTTAGTGSETTLAAVIVDSETRHKYAISDFVLIPKYAILDAKMIHSLPFHIAATTGMDALTHAIEAYIGQSTTKQTRKDAIEAIQLIFENIEQASYHTSTIAEEKMLKASHLAGRAFTRSYVGYVHAVSHSLSGKYDYPHGETNAILLPLILEMYGKDIVYKLAQLAKAVNIGDEKETREQLAKKFIQAIYALNQQLNIPRQIKINEQDIPQLARYADAEANPLYPVPVLWNAKELEVIYRKVKA